MLRMLAVTYTGADQWQAIAIAIQRPVCDLAFVAVGGLRSQPDYPGRQLFEAPEQLMRLARNKEGGDGLL